MTATQRIILERRKYNQWVASEMLEDYALRFTATQARKSTFRVGNTALGPIAFLACEAIGGAITLSQGFPNAALAIAGFVVLMFLIGLPICIYGARYGVDIDLLTRGAGFGYIGSTITSLIYASFTFLLFAIEASIMSVALQLLFGLPLAIGHLICALLVIPIALFGVSLISRMQMLTQPVWLVLQVLPLAYIVWRNPEDIAGWTSFAGLPGASGGSLNWLSLGAAGAVLLSLLPQIGEQVDYLRFMPQQTAGNRRSWWIAVIGAGPGWVLVGGFKLLVGSFLAYLLLSGGATPGSAVEPTAMYRLAFGETFSSPTLTLLITGLFVIVCQLKINVTNAYAGSLAWSNFFSRVTHSHPGRVVWLVFNVLVALCLMEMGILHTIESVLAIYANFAAGWIGAITADLVVNKPLGLSPRGIEFKRAHLYDINPVGVGSLTLAIVASSMALTGLLGPEMQTLAPFLSLLVAFVAAPLIAWGTAGRYYLARQGNVPGGAASVHQCTICENSFEHVDMAMCPAYGGPICSLCCSLDARCRDRCKPGARLSEQVGGALSSLLPDRVYQAVQSRAGRFFSLLTLAGLAIALLLTLIFAQVAPVGPEREVARETLTLVYVVAMILAGLATWGVVLAHESRRAAESETERQTSMLLEEIEAHKSTDRQLQRAKEVAEAANLAKSRYIVGLGHEIRTPLNSIFGYAQLLERRQEGSSDNAIRVIRRSAEHLSGLVDGLLDMSNIEGGVLRLSRDKVNLPELLDQLEGMFRLQAEGKGIGFHCERPAYLPSFVHADQKRLRQILINLLSNAVKYTVRGQASLTVRYRNQVAEFEVTDTGIGIEAPDLERIFKPFERGSGAAVRGIPGTGLGLTITKLLTQVMGGELSVRSSPGVGTTFVVRMLLSEAVHDGKVDNVRWIRGYEGERKSILLIDDNVSHVSILTSLFTSLGFRVSSADTGIGGVARAATSMPDLAIVDISLPDMTGWETIGRIRSLPGSEQLRVVVASANAHESAPGGGTAVHDDFLVKPLDLSVLLASVQRQLQLTWLYKPEALADSPENGVVAGQLSDTATRHIEDLWQLGLIGHVRGIHAKLRDLDAEHPRNRTLAARLRSMVDRFDMSQYMNTLKELRTND
jgi:signal transduction histidine kinase/CheY-like chemotaxis protein